MRKFTKILVSICIVYTFLFSLSTVKVKADTPSSIQLETSVAYTYKIVHGPSGDYYERQFFNTIQETIDFAKGQSLQSGNSNAYQKGYGIYLLKDFTLEKDYILPAKDCANNINIRVGDFFGANLGLPSIQPTTITIDLNGHYIDGNKENFKYDGQGLNGYAAIILSGDKHGTTYDVTLKDSKGGGYVFGSGSGLHVLSGATLNFNSGTVHAKAQATTDNITSPTAYGIYSESVVNLNGGKIDMFNLPQEGPDTRYLFTSGCANFYNAVLNFNSGSIITDLYAIYEDTAHTYLSKDAYYEGYVYSETPITTFHTPVSYLPINYNKTEQTFDLSIYRYSHFIPYDDVVYEIVNVQDATKANLTTLPPISNVRMEGAILKFDYDTTTDLSKKIIFEIKMYPQSTIDDVDKDNFAIPFTVVTEMVAPHTIVASAEANGTISPIGTTKVADQANQTYVLTPNDGYKVKEVLVDGISVGALDSYTFQSVSSDHEIHVTFAKIETPATPTKPNGTQPPQPTSKPSLKQESPKTFDTSNTALSFALLLFSSLALLFISISSINKQK